MEDTETASLTRRRCVECDTAFMDFRQLGLLGCPNDYALFREGLLPLLQRVHRAARHVGKRPKHALNQESYGPRRRLRRQLRLAVEGEDYSRAAELRDRLAAKECHHGSS